MGFNKLKLYSELLLISQTLFALPFAYMGILFAGSGTTKQWILVTIALIAARTAGMSFNRVIDASIDAKNPRTQNRIIPQRRIKKISVWLLSIISCIILVISSYLLNNLCFYLSFVAIILLFTYSYFKRFSSSSHFYLGFVEAAAPIGGYLAVQPSFDFITFLPAIAIMFWIAGLDILYAIQDYAFDKKEGLFSIPVRFGLTNASVISTLSYFISILALITAGILAQMGLIYLISLILVTIIFINQQYLGYTYKQSIEKIIPKIFFLNKFISPVLFLGMIFDRTIVIKLF